MTTVPEARHERAEIGANLDPHYGAFFVEGMSRTCRTVRFARPQVPVDGPYTTAVIDGRRIVFDAADQATVDDDLMAWADVYGKVNPTSAMTDVVAIGPSFGVRTWSAAAAIRAALTTQKLDARRNVVRDRAARFYRQHRYQVPERSFGPSRSDDDYVFAASTIWAGERETNALRVTFMDSAARHGRFEGGFPPRSDGKTYEVTRHLMPSRIPYADYLARTRRSAVVFSTPAVAGCWGWKLGEFLALGKAIIQTTVPDRRLPADLEDGVHCHLATDDPAEIDDAVERIVRDRAYRTTLEAGARRYYDTHVAPQAVVARLLARAG